ncbi:MAG TPA: hypothetical protein VG244_06550 [Acidimicrobiales bacterium]|jgi:hypothetical protein|nr:hypothetical protein [Acidimicrobiales bacterium]
MPTLTETASNGKAALGAVRQRPTPAPSVGRRRQVPWIVGGVLLVVGCALAFGVASLRVAKGEQVLAVIKSVPVGQTLQANDLQVVQVAPTSALDPVPASGEAGVLGRPVATVLVPGTLLTAADVGSPPPGSRGSDVVALALKAGAFPPSLGSGERVEVVPVVGGSSGTSSGSGAPVSGQLNIVRAIVVAVDQAPAGSSANAVVSLQVAPSDAAEVAALAAAGQAVLVEVPSESGG